MFHVHEPLPGLTELRMARSLLGRPLYLFRAWILEGTLIDTGPPAAGHAFGRFLAERPERVRQVINTHYHEDHAGNNALVHRVLGLVPLAHPVSRRELARRSRVPLYRALAWGRPVPAPTDPLPERVPLETTELSWIETPGHCPGHVCFLDPSRGWLFTGDLYLGIRASYARPCEDLTTWRASIARALELDFDTVICSHQGVVPDGKEALRRKLAFWGETEAHARDLRARGWSDREIARALLGKDGFMAWISLGDFSRETFIRSLLDGPTRRRKGEGPD